jgi:hypothetical protein
MPLNHNNGKSIEAAAQNFELTREQKLNSSIGCV